MNALMKALERALALAFIFAVCLNFANVIGRYVVGRSIAGADEIQIYIMVAMAFLGAGLVAWRGNHLRMDVLVRFFPRPTQKALRALEIGLVVLLAGFTLMQSARYAWQMAELGRASDMGSIPMWIPHGVVAVGFALIVASVLRK